jgi:hypothetical protein
VSACVCVGVCGWVIMKVCVCVGVCMGGRLVGCVCVVVGVRVWAFVHSNLTFDLSPLNFGVSSLMH